MAITKENLKYNLQKYNFPKTIAGDYSYSSNVDFTGSTSIEEELRTVIGEYSICLADKHINEEESVTDFLFLAPLYADPITDRLGDTVNHLKYPNIHQAHYKSILINAAKHLCRSGYSYGRYGWPFFLSYTQEGVFIGNGVILNKSLNVLFAIKGDVAKNNHKAIFSNPYCIIDKKVFEEKNTVNNFIKNTLFPMLLELGYRIEIDDFSNIDIFEHPVPPQSYDFKEEIQNVLLEGINEI